MSYMVISDVYRSFIRNKNTFTESYSVDFKAPRKFWNPLGKAVPGKFHSSDGHSKHNSLQDRANFYRSRVWQIMLIYNTVYINAIRCQIKIF